MGTTSTEIRGRVHSLPVSYTESFRFKYNSFSIFLTGVLRGFTQFFQTTTWDVPSYYCATYTFFCICLFSKHLYIWYFFPVAGANESIFYGWVENRPFYDALSTAAVIYCRMLLMFVRLWWTGKEWGGDGRNSEGKSVPMLKLKKKKKKTLWRYDSTRWRSLLRHCATSRKVAGPIPDGVTGIFQWLNPSGRIVALGSTQPLTEMSTRNPSWG
jgi:hypothetical protein